MKAFFPVIFSLAIFLSCNNLHAGTVSYELTIDYKGINIDIPDSPIVIAADEVKMLRALINLIHNAIDASPISCVVSVSVESVKEHIMIRISDSGSGMDKGTIENIFIPFYTKKSSGTGLGMAVAKKIIEGHQGAVHIESKLQIGTKVTIKLPK